MEPFPKISIIIPIFNAGQHLDKCIKSVLNQTFADFELILVNDGSTDNSGEICNKFAETDKRIIVINKKNGGVSSARNAGLDAAKGDYIGWVDADDWIAPDMFEFLLRLMVENKADISECGYAQVQNGVLTPAKFGDGVEKGSGGFLIEKFISGDIYYGMWNKLFKKEVFGGLRFPNARVFEDTWWTLYFCLEDLNYVRNPEVKYYYEQTQDSIIRSVVSPRKAREYIYILENQLSLVNEKVVDPILKNRLYQRIMEKSVFWYLDLALSENKFIRKVYSKAYQKRMKWPLIKLLKSEEIPLKNKITFSFCKIGLGFIPFYAKKQLS